MATVVVRPDQPAVPFPAPYNHYVSYSAPLTYTYTNDRIISTPQSTYSPFPSPEPLSPPLHQNTLPRSHFSQSSKSSNSSQQIFPLLSDADAASLKSRIEDRINSIEFDTTPTSNKRARRKHSLYLLLTHWRVYICILAILSTLVSLGFIIAALILFPQVHKEETHPPSNATKYNDVTTNSCTVFASVAVGNIVLAVTVLILGARLRCMKVGEACVSVMFALSAAVAAGSTIAACVYLKRASGGLWWGACQEGKGVDGGIGIMRMCNAIELGWALGIVHAGLEGVAVLVSVLPFVMGGWA